MKVFSILLILLLAYIAVSDASPSPQSPDTDGMVEGDSQSRLKRGIDDITSFGRDKRDAMEDQQALSWLTHHLKGYNLFKGICFISSGYLKAIPAMMKNIMNIF
ncbi:uncharacterized protein LOC123682471 isoform X8 [Harmonia axyridis]|uniref:uncharacterized protein LOC123682471 isoform X8 n=1 Tax=Harmonia axyridis TaxID=115357 RepID=UPI001E27896B|nr:uncharacterized protein LOC123682471 isoform X8 [Harmonia axyridis]